ncbi:MAG TPA: carbohydrate kinase family protein [Rectinemataceae bacterium]
MRGQIKARDEAIETLPSISHGDRIWLERLIATLEASDSLAPGGLDKRVGGGCAIVCMTAAALGMKSVCVGAVGRDVEADFLETSLAEKGVEARFLELDRPTGIFLSLQLWNGERRIAVAPGAAAHLTSTGSSLEMLRPGWAFHVDGLLLDEAPWLDAAAEEAHERGTIVSLDLSTAFAVRNGFAQIDRFVRERCDIVFANEEEDRAFEGLGGEKPETCIWVSKLGERGASSSRGSEALAFAKADVPLEGDCTGAGDAFAAGYLASALDGLSESSRLMAANRLAYSRIISNRRYRTA